MQVGDRVWMREAHTILDDVVLFAADGHEVDRWTPAVHMHRSICRFVGEVVGVRRERLQDISEEDAEAEGMGSLTSRDLCAIFGIKKNNLAASRVDLIAAWGESRVFRFAVLMELMTHGIWALNPMVTVIEWRNV